MCLSPRAERTQQINFIHALIRTGYHFNFPDNVRAHLDRVTLGHLV